MLDYEWGNQSTIMFTSSGGGADEPSSQPDPTRDIFDHYFQCFNDNTIATPVSNRNDFFHHIQNPPYNHHHHHILNNTTQTHPHFSSSYDPRAYGGYCAYPPPSPLLSLEPVGGNSHDQARFMLMPKPESYGCSVDFMNSPLGLNLGGRTYFSSAEDDFVNRLYRRSRPLDIALINSPRCQAEGCNADLSHAKHYHRRHKVCEFHSKASTVVAAGLTQRFCQQCSRFHLLSEFDDGKRSCRKRLANHNRRRRKSSQNQANDVHKKSTSENVTSSPPDSEARSSSLLTLKVSPSRTSFDCFQMRLYQEKTSTSSTSNGSIFFSNG